MTRTRLEMFFQQRKKLAPATAGGRAMERF